MRRRRSGHLAWPSNLGQHRHGTASRYGTLGCRCRRCTDAYAAYRRGALSFSDPLPTKAVPKLETDWWPARP